MMKQFSFGQGFVTTILPLILSLAFGVTDSLSLHIPIHKVSHAQQLRVKSLIGATGLLPTNRESKTYFSTPIRPNKSSLLLGSDDNSDGDYDNWEAGVDLQSDLQKLRMAVWENNAESDLKEKERIHLLNEFAIQRRELLPDVKKYILRPIVAIVFLVYIQGKRDSSIGMTLLKKSLHIFLRIMNMIYIISIFAPLIMHKIVSQNEKKKQTKFEKRDQNLFGIMNDDDNEQGIDSRHDCNNYSLCLLENWVTSIYPSVIFHLVMVLLSLRCHINPLGYYNTSQKQIEMVTPVLTMGRYVSRLLTRIAAAASLHQFPKLLYDLRRSNQPRPIARIPFILRRLIEMYLLILPFGIVADATCLFAFLPQFKKQMRDRMIIELISPISLLLLGSMILPLTHIIALIRIIRVGHFTNISLAMDQEKALELLDNKDTDGFKLRYKLQWRPPFRILTSGKTMFRNFVLFLFRGWGEQASIMNGSTGVVSSSNEPYILTLLGNEMGRNETNSMIQTVSDRSRWIQDASDRMAKIHEQSYKNQIYDDPLGIAFQQTFGIGISLDFDHDSRLLKNERPSVHRLRARAAKSVIKSFNALSRQVEYLVDNIQDQEEKVKEYNRLLMMKQKEMYLIAREISRLIPVNAPSPEGKDLDVFSMKMSEAKQFDSVSLPWLKDIEENLDDPYLSFEDAFLHEQKAQNVDNIDEDDDLFKDVDTVLT